MTLNVAHGRGEGTYQILQRGRSIEGNLDEIAMVIKRKKPDILALQEVEGPSLWSGMIDQVEYLAQKAGFPYSIRGEHVKGLHFAYGTALLSRFPIKEPVSITFPPSPPTLSKGFVMATITWPGEPGIEMDVVSLHLDFSRRSIRKRQIEDFIHAISPRKRPLIVMGDFNCEWISEEPVLGSLSQHYHLRGYRPENPGMDTFPLLGRRVDWILVSPELEFMTYQVLPDTISDHRGVICELIRSG